jgi:hypothetical protein
LKTEALNESNQKHISVKNFGLKLLTIYIQFPSVGQKMEKLHTEEYVEMVKKKRIN